jgi:cyclopropane-fatty-acyl-phospholipid synthase
MGYLTTEHHKAGYAADFVLYGGAALGLSLLLVLAGPPARRPELLALALVGLFAWTLVEYGLHRFVLHGPQPFRGWHEEHHRRPRALIGTPTVLSATLIAALVFMPAVVFGDLWRACALTLGLLTGYFLYSVMHHAIHHWRPGNAWTRRARRWHALHHSPVEPAGRYGVSSGLWDVVFGTAGRRAPRARDASVQLDAWENEGGAPGPRAA